VLPVDIGFRIFEFLDARSLCNIMLVNSQLCRLANNDYLWKRLCQRKIKVLNVKAANELNLNWKEIHRLIQKFVFLFNMDAEKGLNMFVELGLINSSASSLATFLRKTSGLNKFQIGKFIALSNHIKVLEEFVRLEDCRDLLLAEALGNFLSRFEVPKYSAHSRVPILENFADHYSKCNPYLGIGKETITVLCFSLVLLGTDLSSPHVKNKMSKREFIRNNKRIVESDTLSDDYLGELYDYVFVEGLFGKGANRKLPRRCNAVLTQATRDAHQTWQIYPRVIALIGPRAT